jgi:hypothetical protein
MKQKHDEKWAEARRLCRLSAEDVRMAKELGFQPKSLMKNIPSPAQRWKMPVKDWVRSIYQEKFGTRQPQGSSAAPEEEGIR